MNDIDETSHLLGKLQGHVDSIKETQENFASALDETQKAFATTAKKICATNRGLNTQVKNTNRRINESEKRMDGLSTQLTGVSENVEKIMLHITSETEKKTHIKIEKPTLSDIGEFFKGAINKAVVWVLVGVGTLLGTFTDTFSKIGGWLKALIN